MLCIFRNLDQIVLRDDGDKILPNLLLQILDISPLLELIKNWCQCKLAIRTPLSAEWDMDIEVLRHRI